jgi:hypothetical protein
MPDAKVHPQPRVRMKKHTSKSPQVHRNNRHSLRGGLTAYSTLFPAIGFIVTVPGRMRKHSCRIDVSVETSEPRGFAVRIACNRLLQRRRPSHPVIQRS